MEQIFGETLAGIVAFFLQSNLAVKTLILFLGFVLRGEITMLLAIYLTMKGALKLDYVLLVSVVSLIIGDNFYYFLGYLFRKTHLSQKIKEKYLWPQKAQRYFRHHAGKLVAAAKFTIGLTLMIMVTSGWTGVKFKKFFLVQAATVIVWTALMGGFSYLFISGLSLLEAKEMVAWIQIGLAAIAVGSIAGGEIYLQRKIRKEMLIENNHRHQNGD